MNVTSLISRTTWRPSRLTPEGLRHGVQLAAAVVLAYAASLALGLPEGLWAVMSALIVTRPQAGATFDAGWERVKGSGVGIACGLAGIAIEHLGLGPTTVTLTIVAALAFATAGVPALRSAPISALILLSAGALPGHSPFLLAGLRAAEIAVGIGVGLAVSFWVARAQAATRLQRGMSAVRGELVAQTRLSLGTEARSASQQLAAAQQLRLCLTQLGALAASADREGSLRPWRPTGAGLETHRQQVRLLGRLAQDAALFGRLRQTLPALRDDPLWTELGDAVCGAIEARSAAGLADFGRRLKTLASERPELQEPARLLAGPLRLLGGDLKALAPEAPVTSACP